MRFPNNYLYWFKHADDFLTIPLGLPAFFNDGCDFRSDETSDYGEVPLMRAQKMKAVTMRTMVTMVTTRRMAQVADRKPKGKRRRKLNQSPQS